MKRFIFAIAILPWLGYACNQSYKNRAAEVATEESADRVSPPEQTINFSEEGYARITENGFAGIIDQPLSTFSVDVDKASYSNVRRFLNNGQLPPAGAVRIEEMINYFDYDYQQPTGDDPFNVITEVAGCPWNAQHQLVQIALKGKELSISNQPPSNLVFLIDVSGSMQDEDKLPLLKKSLLLLVENLREDDNVSIVTYAGSAGLALPSTRGSRRSDIEEAIESLEAGGATAGGEGIQLAYKIAREHFKKNGNNRVIMATDGDFNVGVSSEDELVHLIEKERENGVFLSILGLGTGNYQDGKMQQLADKGNGNHYYIDGLQEAKKVLVNEFSGTLFTIAKDVKIQVEFNPAKVQAYRLIGYENRMLNQEDFNDDKKDAGEIGAGHTVTALYEVIPVYVKNEFIKKGSPRKYRKAGDISNSNPDELFKVKLRYKRPGEEQSRKVTISVPDNDQGWYNASDNFRLAAAVAEFGMLLRNSDYKSKASYEQVLAIAKTAQGIDGDGYRAEFTDLIKAAKKLKLRI